MIYKLAWVGAQGSAKTTTVNRVTTMFEKLGTHVYKIPEVARECPFPINEETGVLSQLWMLNYQMVEEIKGYNYIKNKVDGYSYEGFILCDRSLYDPIMYSRSAVKKGTMKKEDLKTIETTAKTCLEAVAPYDHIFLCEPKPLYDDGVRSMDEEWQKEIFDLWKAYVKEKGLKVTIVQ